MSQYITARLASRSFEEVINRIIHSKGCQSVIRLNNKYSNSQQGLPVNDMIIAETKYLTPGVDRECLDNRINRKIHNKSCQLMI